MMNSIRLTILTALALVAFASNSLLCRLALGSGLIDAATFSTIRIVSGALFLLIILALPRRSKTRLAGNWSSGGMLALYAISFSFAYMKLSAGTGALILFAGVQATMMVAALYSGERLRVLEWSGFAVALFGFGWLVAPGVHAPSLLAAVLMAIAGFAWGVYSLRGRGIVDSLPETAGNFSRAVPIALLVSVVTLRMVHVSMGGLALAILSGAIASGVGYVIWYYALRELRATTAALVQLVVPVLAAAGGIVFLAEDLNLRFVVSTVLILGGVLLALAGRQRRAPTSL